MSRCRASAASGRRSGGDASEEGERRGKGGGRGGRTASKDACAARRLERALRDGIEGCVAREEKQSAIVTHAAAHVIEADLHVLRGCSDMGPRWRRHWPDMALTECTTLHRHVSDTPRHASDIASRATLAASHSITSVARQAMERIVKGELVGDVARRFCGGGRGAWWRLSVRTYQSAIASRAN